MLGVTAPLWVSGIWAVFDSGENNELMSYFFGSLLLTPLVLIGLGVWLKPVEKKSEKAIAALVAIPLLIASFFVLFMVLVYSGHMTQ